MSGAARRLLGALLGLLALAGCGTDSVARAVLGGDGGVYRTEDRGDSWSRAGLSGSTITFVGFDVHRPEALYAGVGDGTLRRSTDRGQTWTVEREFADDETAAHVAADPLQSSVRYIGTNQALYRSDDDGASWAQVLDSAVSSMVFDPAQAQTVYAYTGFDVHRSRDGGASWVEVGSFEELGSGFGSNLVLDVEEPNALFVGNTEGIYRSQDGGLSWIAVHDEAANALALDPRTGVLYAGTNDGLVRSVDGGDSWTRAGNLRSVSVLAIDLQTPQLVYAVVSGVHRSEDGGDSWVAAGHPGSRFPILSLAVDPARPGAVYAGTIDPGDL